jgi:DMSO/TMAO reductase YedYZ molybdopterin-dependent catalytic subunit
MRHELTILTYEMTGQPVSAPHGDVIGIRKLEFKTVKWITAIEFVHDFAGLDTGQGGYNEGHEFYGYRMPI